MMHRCLTTLTLMLLLLVGAPNAGAQAEQRCFPETGQCTSGRIREFWEQNGGLAVFGFPTGAQGEVQIESKSFQAQLFERNRLELHPENQRPYDVLLSRLGADRLAQQGRDPFTFTKNGQQPGCRYFPETQHNVCGDILMAWHASGLEFDGKRGKSEAENLALFGLPLSDLQTENIQGKDYQAQWFERARFELHPENPPPYNVLLGLLGNEIRDHQSSPTFAPPAPPKPLPEPTFNACQEDPNPGAAPDYPVQIVGINKSSEVVTLKNVSPEPIDLTGWHMCSIKGNQEHPISGTLAPGAQMNFDGPAASIWNNGEQDNGSLYNATGQLVSYWPD
ncbi:MAG: lamin tail domain-containing protein [Roseiflexaceae bacterium]